MIKPGRETSEYWKALRAEAIGVALAITGSCLVLNHGDMEREVVGGFLLLVGAGIIVKALDSYSLARGAVKAAAVRRPAEFAPKGGL